MNEDEKKYMEFIKKRDGQKDDYLYQEALEDMKQLDLIDPPDEEK